MWIYLLLIVLIILAIAGCIKFAMFVCNKYDEKVYNIFAGIIIFVMIMLVACFFGLTQLLIQYILK